MSGFDGINWNDLLRALALLLVFEGILPFAAPARSRLVFARLSSLGDRPLRLIALGSMLAGVTGLELVRLCLED